MKRLFVATILLASYMVKGSMTLDHAIDLAIASADLLIERMEEKKIKRTKP